MEVVDAAVISGDGAGAEDFGDEAFDEDIDWHKMMVEDFCVNASDVHCKSLSGWGRVTVTGGKIGIATSKMGYSMGAPQALKVTSADDIFEKAASRKLSSGNQKTLTKLLTCSRNKQQRLAYGLGLLNGRLIWFDGFVANLWFYIYQRHTVLGIILAAKKSPYNQVERIVVYICMTLGTFLTSQWLRTHYHAGDYYSGEMWAANISCAIMLMIWAKLCYYTAATPCLMPGACCSSCNRRGNIALVSHVALGSMLLLSVAAFVAAWFVGADATTFGYWALTKATTLLVEVFELMIEFVLFFYGCPCIIKGQKNAKTFAAYPFLTEYGLNFPTRRRLVHWTPSCARPCIKRHWTGKALVRVGSATTVSPIRRPESRDVGLVRPLQAMAPPSSS